MTILELALLARLVVSFSRFVLADNYRRKTGSVFADLMLVGIFLATEP